MKIRLSRREIAFAGIGFVAFSHLSRANAQAAARWLPDIDALASALIPGGIVSHACIENDIAIGLTDIAAGFAVMQTNGVLLRLDLTVPAGSIDVSRICIDVTDNGHAEDGSVVAQPRTIGVRRTLVGPVGRETLESSTSRRLLLVLDAPIFNQDANWRTSIVAIRLATGWRPSSHEETIPGALIERVDGLSYPPFPVKPLTPPFLRLAPEQPIDFEVTGMNDFARDGRMFARVEAWLRSAGRDGPIVGSEAMVASALTDAQAPSGLPAPAYRLRIAAIHDLPQGNAEIAYRALPFIGPPWSSLDQGQVFPTLSAPRAVPVCHDLSGSWAPLYGIVAQDGVGLAGTDPRGLATNIDAALSSGWAYRDAAAVASAARLVNRAGSAVSISNGSIRRAVPHDDIAGGVAVLPPVPGSAPGSNFGAYLLRTSMGSTTTYPPGACWFEIRSLAGVADAAVRLRGANVDGASQSAKTLPTRTLLRGIWLDGSGLTGPAHIVIDGLAAGAPTNVPVSALSWCHLLSIDNVITENPFASGVAPVRFRAGYVWDVRLRHTGAGGAAALGVTTGLAGIVASVGSAYAADTAQRLTLTTYAGCHLTNIALRDADAATQSHPRSRLGLNLRIDYSVAMPSPAIMLGSSSPSRGGLGLGNVFVRGRVASSGPGVQIGADSAFLAIDNAIIRHFSSDMPGSTKLSDGRTNLLYQAQGYVRADKVGSVSYSAFHCYSTKGDSFAAAELPRNASTSWSATRSYPQGSLVHDTAGSSVPASCFYQAMRDVDAGTPLSDARAWHPAGQVFALAYGSRPLRQGNARFRYHIGCRGNVAASTYNSDVPGRLSGYGFAWGSDEAWGANYESFYVNRFGDDYRPSLQGPLVGRVSAGMACLPFDLSGTPRMNDGRGAAGAYEASYAN